MDAAEEHDWIKEGLLIEGLRDWSMLSNVHSCFLTATEPRRPIPEVQQLTLNMIRELVSEGLFDLGSIEGTNRHPYFEKWELTLDEAMAKIEDAYVTHFDDRWNWVAMCWLQLTDKGKDLALKLYHADEPGD